jgi:8-oxo-dGTP diphosphatase
VSGLIVGLEKTGASVVEESVERRQRLSAYAVVIHEGEMLLALIAPGYPGAGQWTLPGGGLHWGESPEEAVHRELYEEAGLRGEVTALLGIDTFQIERRVNGRRVGFHAIRVIYEMTAAGEPRVTEVDGSVTESRWVPVDEVAALPTSSLVTAGLRLLASPQAR